MPRLEWFSTTGCDIVFDGPDEDGRRIRVDPVRECPPISWTYLSEDYSHSLTFDHPLQRMTFFTQQTDRELLAQHHARLMKILGVESVWTIGEMLDEVERRLQEAKRPR